MYNRVENFEEAKRVMQELSPGKTEILKKANLDSIFIYGLGLLGTEGLLFGATKISPKAIIPLLAAPFIATTIRAACKTLKEKKKNEAILNGEYFVGKSEEEIIREANDKYVSFTNNYEQIEENLRSGENAKSR